jgi:uncharacterized protein (DUF1800 family)
MLRKALLALALACSLSIPVFTAYAKKAKTPESPAIPQMPDDQKILHALNRLAYGPRPGDVEMVRKLGGLERWIEIQLYPQSLPENQTLLAKLQPLDSLVLPPNVMIDTYPSQQLIRAMVDGRVPFPEDPVTRMMIRRQAEKYTVQEEAKNKKDPQAIVAQKRAEEYNRKPDLAAILQGLTPEQRDTLTNGTPLEKVTLLENLPVATQIDIVDALKPQQRQGLFALAPPTLRRRITMLNGQPQQIVYSDLTEGKLLRAVYSNRQLEEVLTDFWFNHFNVFFDKGSDRDYVTAYERDVIRPNVLGKFHDLLLATAQSPAMLFYLDNWESVGPNSEQGASLRGKGQHRGLNENYGRELMELHTLGVDGGYTQKDVTEVARCFTGWTIRNPQRGGNFEFNPRMHDNGEKMVLGVRIPAGGGMEDGLKVLDVLSKSPATARFISKKLAMRFVSDNPPAALLDRMSKTFLATDGDLREVLRAMFTSPEFWSPDMFHAKVKTPVEMVASALRATNANVDYTFLLAAQLNIMGQPLYRKVEPTGYSSRNAEWMNSAALLGRMNFSLALVSNRVPGIKVDLTPFQNAQDPTAIAHALLMTNLSANTLKAIQLGVDNPEILQQVNERAGGMGNFTGNAIAPNKTALLAGLTLGSPDFQRR